MMAETQETLGGFGRKPSMVSSDPFLLLFFDIISREQKKQQLEQQRFDMASLSKASAVLIFLSVCAPQSRSEVFSSSDDDANFRAFYHHTPPSDGNASTADSAKHASVNGSARRDQSRDLKRLIQELEESDYSNYGSWGNFRSRPPPPPPPQHTLSSSSSSAPHTPDARRGHTNDMAMREEFDDGASFGEYPDDPYYPYQPGTPSPFLPQQMRRLLTHPYDLLPRRARLRIRLRPPLPRP